MILDPVKRALTARPDYATFRGSPQALASFAAVRQLLADNLIWREKTAPGEVVAKSSRISGFSFRQIKSTPNVIDIG
jgi:hypothetical protein